MFCINIKKKFFFIPLSKVFEINNIIKSKELDKFEENLLLIIFLNKIILFQENLLLIIVLNKKIKI